MISADTCRYLHFVVRHFLYLDRRLRLPGTVTICKLPVVVVVMVEMGSNFYFEVMTFVVIGSNDVVIQEESGQKVIGSNTAYK